jgi:hypothetical protein
MFETCAKGSSIELKCAAGFVERGFEVSFPYGNGARYDFIVDDGLKLYRIQCKKARKAPNGNYYLCTRSSHRSGNKVVESTYTREQVDYFCTIVDGIVLVVDIKKCENKKGITIHANGKKNVKASVMAVECLLENVFSHLNLEQSAARKEWYRNDIVDTRRKKILPPKEEFFDAISTLPITQVARKFHTSIRRVHEIAEQYEIPLAKGIDAKRIRARGVYDRTREKLKAYYMSHVPESAKPVVQYSLDGIKIGEYESSSRAGSALGFMASQIRRVCRGKRKSYKGFLWRYKEISEGPVAQQ